MPTPNGDRRARGKDRRIYELVEPAAHEYPTCRQPGRVKQLRVASRDSARRSPESSRTPRTLKLVAELLRERHHLLHARDRVVGVDQKHGDGIDAREGAEGVHLVVERVHEAVRHGAGTGTP